MSETRILYMPVHASRLHPGPDYEAYVFACVQRAIETYERRERFVTFHLTTALRQTEAMKSEVRAPIVEERRRIVLEHVFGKRLS
jgi:hypothetical protein